MIEYITSNFIDFSVKTLSTSEKLRGFSRLHGKRGMADIRIFVAGLILVGVLLVALMLYRKSRKWKEEEISKDLFDKSLERLALNAEESQLLLDIAKGSKLKKIDSIFTVSRAFDQGSSIVMKRSFSKGKTLVERKHLNQQIISLKEKLGFKEKAAVHSPDEYSFRHKGLSSRQIPVGRNVLISRTHSKDAYPVTAVVAENSHFELKLKTEDEFPGKPGEIWRVLYQLGAVLWKFDTLIVSCENRELILSHTDNIRFINRRKFVHAPVSMHGYVARFQCGKTVEDAVNDILPQFIAARITELSGPGLKIIAPLKVRTGERILVIFELSPNRIIQNAAEVRRCENDKDGYVIVAEMIDISEACINELIKATNDAVRGIVAKEEELEMQKQIEEQEQHELLQN
ncbi:MAG: hypothetical protein FVQ82_01235 [Planctomycetes bacterium]|nr:hypothetical protein [Planctomycetota bacterium]